MSGGDDVLVELYHLWGSDTAAAYCVSETGEDDVPVKWLPKSQCARGRCLRSKTSIYVFEMPRWLAEREGWEIEE